MKTWRKALRKLVHSWLEMLATRYPERYQRISAQARQRLVREVWEEVKDSLVSVPRELAAHPANVPAGRPVTMSHRLQVYVIQ
jgi:hypothetical protein